MTILVMVSAQVKPGTEADFEKAFEQVRNTVRGTDGHVGDRLLRAADNGDRYVLVGEWESAEKFLAWENAPAHRNATTPMRPYWNGPVERTVFEVAADRMAAEPDR